MLTLFSSYLQDYPSVSFVQTLLNEQQITAIIVHEPGEMSSYTKLAQFWRSTILTIHSAQSTLLITRIRAAYQVRQDLVLISVGLKFILASHWQPILLAKA